MSNTTNPYKDRNGVAFNLLGITDAQTLRAVEYKLTQARAMELAAKPIQGDFDLAHLKAIHKHIFQDVYPWAGSERTVNFSKKNLDRPGWTGVFSKVSEFTGQAQEAHGFSQSKNHLRGLERAEFVDSMAELYAKWNKLHLFPEGNGRATQTMLTQLAREAGYKLDFNKVSDERWRTAATLSMTQTNIERPTWKTPGSLREIRSVFHRITEPLRAVERVPNQALVKPERERER